MLLKKANIQNNIKFRRKFFPGVGVCEDLCPLKGCCKSNIRLACDHVFSKLKLSFNHCYIYDNKEEINN